MEHNSFPLEFQIPDGKDTLQTAQNVINQKFNHSADVVICSIHVVSAPIYVMSNCIKVIFLEKLKTTKAHDYA